MYQRALMALCLGVVGMAVAEDVPADHHQWMKSLGAQSGALRKGVEVEKNATEMQATLKEVRTWWASRKSDVALKTIDESMEGAAKVAKAAQANDAAGIAEGMKGVNGGCRGCHTAHREKVSENVYRIKY